MSIAMKWKSKLKKKEKEHCEERKKEMKKVSILFICVGNGNL
jgi:hypothetical protein